MILICRHCNQHKANRPRGLCWTCYYCPGVRERYGPVSKYGRRGVSIENVSRPPLEPTDAAPGTLEKMLVLEQRARAGLALHHPADNRGEKTVPRIDPKRPFKHMPNRK
jgi:hypothetical protein